ncbi:acyltransferase [Aeromonas rivipollensis]|uniref:acyltransferase n=1 Tax=Aeromonas rivipollensis TaxID=948519 RepID=UPI003D2346AD
MKKIFKLINRMVDKLHFFYLEPTGWAKRKGVKLGRNCKLNKKISWGSEPYLISIGDDFYCSSNITFITHDGSVHILRTRERDKERFGYFGSIEIGDNVFIGYGATILPNSKIGSNVIVGACSLVKGELKSNSVYAGVPAKYICSIDDYFNKIKPHLDEIPRCENAKKVFLIKKYMNV